MRGYKAVPRGIALLLVAALASCATDRQVEVRTIGGAHQAAGSDPLALGRGALALGNAGLALEQFRHALRANPQSIAALGGIAACYDEIGRADLARRYHEEALALAPANVDLLRAYAASLARHGAHDEAQAVIAEVALRSKAPAAQWVVEPATTVYSNPPAKLAEPAEPAAGRAPKTVRLERLSLGEIALVTSGGPIWTKLPTATPARPIRLLNAARREGLAARHRAQLAGAGWRRVVIGDAGLVRRSSLILYPLGQRGEARRLSQRLRIAALRPELRADILVLLGRDRG